MTAKLGPELAYIPVEISWRNDTKIKSLFNRYGNTGLLVWITVLGIIYGEYGYWCAYDDELFINVACDLKDTTEETVKEIIDYAALRGLFDRELLVENSVLTSKAICRRYQEITSRRRKGSIDYATLPYWVDPLKGQNDPLSGKDDPLEGQNDPVNPAKRVRQAKARQGKVSIKRMQGADPVENSGADQNMLACDLEKIIACWLPTSSIDKKDKPDKEVIEAIAASVRRSTPTGYKVNRDMFLKFLKSHSHISSLNAFAWGKGNIPSMIFQDRMEIFVPIGGAI